MLDLRRRFGLPAGLYSAQISSGDGGTGLGLAISRGFVEAMHGTITAANRTDRTGAVFTIRLPVPAVRQKLESLGDDVSDLPSVEQPPRRRVPWPWIRLALELSILAVAAGLFYLSLR